jgi:hypothetical protein
MQHQGSTLHNTQGPKPAQVRPQMQHQGTHYNSQALNSAQVKSQMNNVQKEQQVKQLTHPLRYFTEIDPRHR